MVLTFPIGFGRVVDLEGVDAPSSMGSCQNDVGINAHQSRLLVPMLDHGLCTVDDGACFKG